MPRRIQLSRRKGFRLAPNAMSVARPTKWGNPFPVAEYGRAEAVRRFRAQLLEQLAAGAVDLTALRGKDLACWCALPRPGAPDICHAAVLLEFANR